MRFAHRTGMAVSVLTAASLVTAGAAMATTASPGSPARPGAHGARADAARIVYGFTTLDNPADPTFNQLLGINDAGVIAGYFGSGAQGHPNKGYLLARGAYINENFPGSVQTQVTGLNNRGVTVGFWSDMNNADQVNDNFGFYAINGQVFHTVNFPTTNNASPPVNQLLGVNDADVAVGFYTDAQGNNHGYTFSIFGGTFRPVLAPGSPNASLTAAAINDRGDTAGFYTNAAGVTVGFLKTAFGRFTNLAFPGASATNALGVNNADEVVGVYTVGAGGNAASHGFTWTPQGGFTTVDDPQGAGTTTINGVNDQGDLVGFFTDAQGNTDGFLATPAHRVVRFLRLAAMPQGTVTFGTSSELTVQVNAFGLTPGSSHTVQLVGPNGNLITTFSTLAADGAGRALVTLTSLGRNPIPPGSRLVILNGTGADPVSAEPIARTEPIMNGGGGFTFALHAADVDQNGVGFGTPRGSATVVYDPNTQTITVTLTASGLTPGMHAAHIHVGSCQSQGPVQYMLMDFVANAQGQVVHQVRTVTGVTTSVPATGWYLNLHLGNGNNILANGQPTLFFRPLLCANI